MVEQADLVDIAGELDAPYQPVPVVSEPTLTVSVVIYEGPRSWHREAVRAELLIVLEGVVTVDSRDGLLVVNEGEVALVPSRSVFDYNSGMRTTALLVQEPVDPEVAATETVLRADSPISKRGFAVDALHAGACEWRHLGSVGEHEAYATRALGSFRTLTVTSGGVVVIVFRGVLDVTSGDGKTSIVGGQLLFAPEGAVLNLRSERGATVLVLVGAGAQPPGRLGG